MFQEPKQKNNLKEVAKVFLKLGAFAFGGPAAHIAMMESEVVNKRKWMTPEHFLDLVGATNLIPGPNSTEMTMHCGYERAGWRGLLVAGSLFILPAILITMIFAYFYEKYGDIPEVEMFIYGIQPAVIAIIIGTVYRLGKKAFKTTKLMILGILTLSACFLGTNEIVALFGCGILGILLHGIHVKNSKPVSILPLFLFQISIPTLSLTSWGIFWTFLKVGSLLYGGGYVLFAFLNVELVSTGILTRRELIDAIAIGQFTPGPVLSTATFIGWQINGFWGALAATCGIFLPSFLFVFLLNPLVPKLRSSQWMSAFLDAVNCAAVAVIAYVCFEMGKSAISDWRSVFIAIVSILVVFRFKKISAAYVVLGAAVLGALLVQF